MLPGSKQAGLQDILNYKTEDYMTPEETALIQQVFGKNPALINILRKLMLPSVGDSSLPIEQMKDDVWLAGRDYATIPDAEIKSVVLGRQEAIKFIMGGLIKLKVFASVPVETKAEAAARAKADSTQ